MDVVKYSLWGVSCDRILLAAADCHSPLIIGPRAKKKQYFSSMKAILGLWGHFLCQLSVTTPIKLLKAPLSKKLSSFEDDKKRFLSCRYAYVLCTCRNTESISADPNKDPLYRRNGMDDEEGIRATNPAVRSRHKSFDDAGAAAAAAPSNSRSGHNHFGRSAQKTTGANIGDFLYNGIQRLTSFSRQRIRSYTLGSDGDSQYSETNGHANSMSKPVVGEREGALVDTTEVYDKRRKTDRGGSVLEAAVPALLSSAPLPSSYFSRGRSSSDDFVVRTKQHQQQLPT
jgi:hypothetical protein